MPSGERWRAIARSGHCLLGTGIRWSALGLIWLFRVVVSPVLPGTCRFKPSCSVYAEQAIRRYGLVKGGWLAGKRVLRCHPWHPGGYDPVP